MKTPSVEDWCLVSRRLVAKALAELHFEEVISCVPLGPGFRVDLASGVSYRFTGWITLWSFLRIDADSLERRAASVGGWEPVYSAGQLFVDAQAETGMDDIILGQFLDEMQRTLFSDVTLLQQQRRYHAADWIRLDGDRLQGLCDGHPKALLNKGRLGWSSLDVQRYAPEAQAAFQLFWIAVQGSAVHLSLHPDWSREKLLRESMQVQERERFELQLMRQGLDREQIHIMPLHPWQWEHVVAQQFTEAIAARDIVPLGVFGDHYRPQISLRTMSNVERPERLQIKLALSILNTSAVRGLPAQATEQAPELAQWLATLCEQDDRLRKSGVRVLKDVAGLSMSHRIYAQVKAAPYRYHEYLGAIWRESPAASLEDGEQAVLTAALFQKDSMGSSLLLEWIRESGLSIADWIKAYAQVVILPLYHLQCRYGVGIVAHGQNIVVRLRRGRPVGVFLKDLQGDLRLVDEDWPELMGLSESIRTRLTRLPPHYLIHDLQTGHFVTVLRFVSAVLQETAGFPETSFYEVIAAEIRAYVDEEQALADRIHKQRFLEKEMPRILINKVRFQIGYADRAERPLPALGSPLRNPLHLASQGERHVHGTL